MRAFGPKMARKSSKTLRRLPTKTVWDSAFRFLEFAHGYERRFFEAGDSTHALLQSVVQLIQEHDDREDLLVLQDSFFRVVNGIIIARRKGSLSRKGELSREVESLREDLRLLVLRMNSAAGGPESVSERRLSTLLRMLEESIDAQARKFSRGEAGGKARDLAMSVLGDLFDGFSEGSVWARRRKIKAGLIAFEADLDDEGFKTAVIQRLFRCSQDRAARIVAEHSADA